MKLDPLFQPASIAVVGASDRPSAGRAILSSLQRMGYDRPVYPINPRYQSVLGYRCYPSLDAIPGEVDAVAFCVANNRLADSYRSAVAKGMRGAVIYSAGFSESHDPAARMLSREIVGLSKEAGVAMVGPNCMGVINPATGSSLYLHEVFDPVRVSGQVGFISQSGSICIGMLADCRRYGFSHAVSTGNEEVVSLCDVVEALIDDPATRVIAGFIESVRDPERFVALLDRAADHGKPVVVLKVGKTGRAQRAIVSHTGGLAGESHAFSAVLKAHRGIEVDDLGAMAEVLAACQGHAWPTGNRLAVVTGSGGQAELLLDIAAGTPIQLPSLSDADRIEIERVVGPVPGEGNPLDAWGNGTPEQNYPHALAVLGRSPGYDVVAFCGDGMDGHPLDDPKEDLVYAEMVAAAAAHATHPLAFLTPRAGVFRTDQEAVLRKAGVPMLSGAREALEALAKLAAWSTPRPEPRAAGATAAVGIDRLRHSIHEYDAKQLLTQAGVPCVRERLVPSLEAAQAAAAEIGYPVVLKIASDTILHKTEHGLVALGLSDAQGVAEAWQQLSDRLSAIRPTPIIAGFLVQEMVNGGIEVLAGMNWDPDFGPMLVFSLGGTLVDLAPEVALRPLPLRAGDAEAMIAETPAAAKLLGGTRGGPAADIEALAACLYALSDFLGRTGDAIAELDLNPIKVMPRGTGCVVVDALIKPRSAT